uniref:(northern house mosquito) hypothetical protein n=1 Tax=Culex pipiens TaxID=7175 RepID=A0A8D8MBH9_CULPI
MNAKSIYRTIKLCKDFIATVPQQLESQVFVMLLRLCYLHLSKSLCITYKAFDLTLSSSIRTYGIPNWTESGRNPFSQFQDLRVAIFVSIFSLFWTFPYFFLSVIHTLFGGQILDIVRKHFSDLLSLVYTLF